MNDMTELEAARRSGPRRQTTVATGLGPIRGLVGDGFQVFRGIRYAQPPLGPRRFLPPQPVPPWSGVLDACAFGPVPFQPHDDSVGHGLQDMSEDCLSLNIWTPARPAQAPVLVWIHGGGQTIGSAQRLEYGGHHLARQGVVCVTVQYRLGALGFLELGDLLGPAYAGSGNHALRDLLLALQWVHQHIAAFGGDPQRVTLGGESAGAKNAVALSGVPAARGLFHRLVCLSGGAQTVHTQPDAQAVARLVCEAAVGHVAQAHRLLDLPATDLLVAQAAAARRWGQRFAFRPVVDGDLLPAPVLDQLAAKACPALPTLLGFARDECAGVIDPARAADPPDARMLSHVSVERFVALERQHAALRPHVSAFERRLQNLTAQEYAVPSIRLADALSGGGGQVWMYRFDGLDGADGRVVPATHVADLPLWWGHPVHAPQTRLGAAGETATRMHQSLLAFVRGEDLSDALRPQPWPRYAPDQRALCAWGTPSTVLHDPDPLLRELWHPAL
ncbi:MAG: hypothetical protein RIQ38_601 [Pseudomonadota bacterium]